MLCTWQKRFRERCRQKLNVLREKEASLQQQLQDALRAKAVLEKETKRLQEHVKAVASNRNAWSRDNGEVRAAFALLAQALRLASEALPSSLMLPVLVQADPPIDPGKHLLLCQRLAETSALTSARCCCCSLVAERSVYLVSTGQRWVHTNVARRHPLQRAIWPAAVTWRADEPHGRRSHSDW